MKFASKRALFAMLQGKTILRYILKKYELNFNKQNVPHRFQCHQTTDRIVRQLWQCPRTRRALKQTTTCQTEEGAQKSRTSPPQATSNIQSCRQRTDRIREARQNSLLGKENAWQVLSRRTKTLQTLSNEYHSRTSAASIVQ